MKQGEIIRNEKTSANKSRFIKAIKCFPRAICRCKCLDNEDNHSNQLNPYSIIFKLLPSLVSTFTLNNKWFDKCHTSNN